MNANFRVISTKVFPSTLIVFTPFIYKLHNFFVELSLSRTRFSEMKQSPLDSHRHCYHYEFYKKNTILLSMKDREKRSKKYFVHIYLFLALKDLDIFCLDISLLYHLEIFSERSLLRYASNQFTAGDWKTKKNRTKQKQQEKKNGKCEFIMKKVIKMCACLW